MIIEVLISIALAASQQTARARGFAQLYTVIGAPAQPTIANNADLGLREQAVPPTLIYHPRILWRQRVWGGGPSRLGGGVTRDFTRPTGRSRPVPAMPPSTTTTNLILGDQAFRR